MICPECGTDNIQFNTFERRKKYKPIEIVLIILLLLTAYGIIIVLPYMLLRKNEVVTIGVCRDCGIKWYI